VPGRPALCAPGSETYHVPWLSTVYKRIPVFMEKIYKGYYVFGDQNRPLESSLGPLERNWAHDVKEAWVGQANLGPLC
jgi:hypothetical protein